MKYKIGMLVYPVLWQSDPGSFVPVELFSQGVFFTDKNKGWEYQEKMNEIDTKYDYWSNNLIQYDLDLDEMNAKVEQVVDILLSK